MNRLRFALRNTPRGRIDHQYYAVDGWSFYAGPTGRALRFGRLDLDMYEAIDNELREPR